MKFRLIGVVLAAGALSATASAADLGVLMQRRAQVQSSQIQPSYAAARIVDQGLGYSVVHQPTGLSPRPYRVHATCTIDESFMQTYCPTPAYYASCPRAQIVCR
jgi:hypothetical protein